jgi:cytochrome c
MIEAIAAISNMPVPNDIMLPLPLPEWFLVGTLIVAFLLHIFFVNIMLGGTLLTCLCEYLGRRDRKYAHLAYEIAQTITVNKSLAVVLGVAPLLAINTLYTVHFYTANIKTAGAWLGLIPLISIAFLLLYLHKYGYHSLENRPKLRLGIIGLASLIFLFVPLIFLSNINLMLFPQHWSNVSGFWSAVLLRNVIFRYFHFLAAALAITGIFLFGYMKRASYDWARRLPGFSRPEILKTWYALTFYATALQLLLGTLNFFTLPWAAVTWRMGYHIIAAVFVLSGLLLTLWWEIRGPQERLGRHFHLIAIELTIIIGFMGVGRHIYRDSALAPHRELMHQKTTIQLGEQERDPKANQVVGIDFSR